MRCFTDPETLPSIIVADDARPYYDVDTKPSVPTEADIREIYAGFLRLCSAIPVQVHDISMASVPGEQLEGCIDPYYAGDRIAAAIFREPEPGREKELGNRVIITHKTWEREHLLSKAYMTWRHQSTYQLGASGLLLRHDRLPLNKYAEKMLERVGLQPPGVLEASVAASEALETTLGINNQPVRIGEFRQLDVVVRRIFALATT